MAVDVTVLPKTTAKDDSLKAIQERVATVICQTAELLGEGADTPTTISNACVELERDFETLMLADVDWWKFAFEATAVRAVNVSTAEQLKDDAFRDMLSSSILEIVDMVGGPLETHYKARLLTTSIAEGRIKARLEIGGGLTPEAEQAEYAMAAAFVTQQLRDRKPVKRPRPKFSIDLG
jgi:hypothetical protein